MRHLYLDYNATTPIDARVREAMLPMLSEHFGNPSSRHGLGEIVRQAVEEARGQAAALLGAHSDEIVFTSGGTESNNLALKGLLMCDPSEVGHLVISNVEHPAITQPARFLERFGYGLTIAPCNRHGVVEPAAIEAALRPNTVLVSIMHSNNETGVIQPIRRIAEICHARNILVHTDAAQSVGKIRTRVDELNVDLMSLAGHKFYAPKGIGALFVRRGVPLEPVLHGAGHERGLRAGTENTPYIVALGRAAMLAAETLDEAAPQMAMLRDRLQSRLREAIGERLTINGGAAQRLPNTLSVNFPGVVGGELLAQVPQLCASTGAACHSGEIRISPTLAALGLSADEARGAVRLSLGWHTSEQEIDQVAGLLIGAWRDLQ